MCLSYSLRCFLLSRSLGGSLSRSLGGSLSSSLLSCNGGGVNRSNLNCGSVNLVGVSCLTILSVSARSERHSCESYESKN